MKYTIKDLLISIIEEKSVKDIYRYEVIWEQNSSLSILGKYEFDYYENALVFIEKMYNQRLQDADYHGVKKVEDGFVYYLSFSFYSYKIIKILIKP